MYDVASGWGESIRYHWHGFVGDGTSSMVTIVDYECGGWVIEGWLSFRMARVPHNDLRLNE
jgi:hypothetical protein